MTQLEYGAQIVSTGTVYMKAGSRAVVEQWIQDYSTAVDALQLVSREVAEIPSRWQTVPAGQ